MEVVRCCIATCKPGRCRLHRPRRPRRLGGLRALAVALALSSAFGFTLVHARRALASPECGTIANLPVIATGEESFTELRAAVGAVASGEERTFYLKSSLEAGAGEHLAIAAGASVTLDLDGCALTITGPSGDEAAIELPSTSTLTIEDTSSSSVSQQGTLTVSATNGPSGGAAGIGGRGTAFRETAGSAGAVVVAGGTVTATGAQGAEATGGGAGIGGGGGGNDSGGGSLRSLLVTGGTVHATGGGGGAEAGGAAGIGGGGGGSGGGGGGGGAISLSGGIVSAVGGSAAFLGQGGPGVGGAGSGFTAGGSASGSLTVEAGSASPSLTGSVGSGLKVVSGAALAVPSGGTLSLEAGSDLNEGTIEVAGTLAGGGSLENKGSIVVSGSQWSVAGHGPGAGSGGLSISGNAFQLTFSSPPASAPANVWVYAPTVAGSGQSLPAVPARSGDSGVGWESEAHAHVTASTPLTPLAKGGVVPLSAVYVAEGCTGVVFWEELVPAFEAGGTVRLCRSIAAPEGDSLTVGPGGEGDNTSVTLDLAGQRLSIPGAAKHEAAIDVPQHATLTIQDTAGGGELNVEGGESAAGIGGDTNGETGETAGAVAIEGGVVVAEGGYQGAGIGGGAGTKSAGGGGRLTVAGAKVTAIGGEYGAGIGGAEGGATATTGTGGAGGELIVRAGGVVEATGGKDAAGIGGGEGNAIGGAGGALVLEAGASVHAHGGLDGAGVGGGFGYAHAGGAGGSVEVIEGELEAHGGEYAAGVGGGGSAQASGGAGGTVLAIAGKLVAQGGLEAAGIGGGQGNEVGGAGAEVEVQGAGVSATGGSLGSGIGGGDGIGVAGGAGGRLTIAAGSVRASGGQYASGIGGGLSNGAGGVGATVQVRAHGALTAVAGEHGTSIGGEGASGFGSLANAGTLTIPAGSTLSVPSGVTAENSGAIDLAGSLQGEGAVQNDGTITVEPGGAVAGEGTGDGSTSLLVHTDNYRISYDLGPGSGSTPEPQRLYAASLREAGLSLPPGPTPPAGRTFSGWFTALHGGTQVTDASMLSEALGGPGPRSATLYAHYTAASQSIEFAPLPASASADSVQPLSATGGPSGEPVTFAVGAASSPADACSVSKNGSGAWSVSFAHAGTCVVEASQAGSPDGEYAAAQTVSQSVDVVPVESVLTLAQPAPLLFGESQSVAASVAEGNAAAPSGSVQFELDGSALGAPVPLEGGRASSLAFGAGSLPPGGHQFAAVFNPSEPSVYGSASATVTQIVEKAQTSTSLDIQSRLIAASVFVLAPGSGTPEGTVVFSVDGAAVGSAPLHGGRAELAYAVPAGRAQQVSAVYSGDADFAGSSASTARRDPSIVAHLHSAHRRNRAGWYRSPVTVTFTCVPAGAPLTRPCPRAVRLARNGAGQSLTRTIEAQDGGAATVTVSGIDIDRTKPVLRVAGVRDHAVYDGEAPKPVCRARDRVSGIARCTVALRTSAPRGELEARTVHYTLLARSRAGARARRTGSYRELGIYLNGARYEAGAFHARPGRTYTLVVSAKTTPRYLYAAPDGASPAGGEPPFHRAGKDRWAIAVALEPRLGARYRRWSLGIEVAGRVHRVTVDLG